MWSDFRQPLFVSCPTTPLMSALNVRRPTKQDRVAPISHFANEYHHALTQRLRQNSRHFPDDSFKRISLNENVWISIEVSLKFVPNGTVNNIPGLGQIMAWPRPGNKPLSEPMMVSLLTHICVTCPQLVNVVAVIYLLGKISRRWNSCWSSALKL